MKKQEFVMGMTAIITIADKNSKESDIAKVFEYFHYIDEKFSPYKKTSELEKINNGKIKKSNCSREMKKILTLSEKTKKETGGYFDIKIDGKIDPSGIVKGYAINQASKMLKKMGYKNFTVEIAGDIQICGKNKNRKWKIGIQNPFNVGEIIKIVYLSNKGIATSGTYTKGNHIVDPVKKVAADEISSVTVIGPDVFEADRFATAAFAMGEKGIVFLNKLAGFEGYLVKKNKVGVMTPGFKKYLEN